MERKFKLIGMDDCPVCEQLSPAMIIGRNLRGIPRAGEIVDKILDDLSDEGYELTNYVEMMDEMYRKDLTSNMDREEWEGR